MTTYLFAPPFWLIPALLLAAAAIFWTGNKRLDKTMKRLGLALLVATVALAITAHLIDTPEEIVLNKTREFVQAVVKRDTATLDKLLDDRAQVGLWSKPDILAGAKRYADQFGLKSARITGIDAHDIRPQLQTRFVIFSDHDAPRLSSTVRTGWEFDWTDTHDGWKLLRITYTPFSDQDPTAVANQYFNRKPTP